jgi:hypothetical protein
VAYSPIDILLIYHPYNTCNMNVLHSISAQKQTSDALLPKRPGRNGSTHAHIVRTGRTQYCDLKKPGGTVRAYTHTCTRKFASPSLHVRS